MKLSIIIPCYNCEKTIGRTLDSILANNFPKNEYEVIICNDKSTDNFLDVVRNYENKMNIVYCETTRDFHCPGNTRQAALSYIKGDYFTFIDNDDMFESDAFEYVFLYLSKNPDTYTLCTNFREYIYEEDKYIRDFVHDETDTWLHGKFFNTAKVLGEYKCHFKEDMFTHEDVYFNSWNLIHLIDEGLNYVYLPIFTYRWIFNKDSITRAHYFNEKHSYIETYMSDYLHGTSDPRFEMLEKSENPDTQLWCLDQIMMALLHAYFYCQASLWKNGELLNSCINSIKEFKVRINEEIGLTDEGIINYIYSKPSGYNDIRQHSIEGTNLFVEVQSFQDFIFNL